MMTESIPITELSLDPSNARKHPEKNLEAIKGSLKRFGQQKPVVVDKNGVIIAGNGTVEAARALGWDAIAVVKSGLLGSDRTAYALADNRTTDLGEWDDEALSQQLKALIDEDFDVSEIGWGNDELKELLYDESEPEPKGGESEDDDDDDDEIPDDVPAITKVGETIEIGPATLLQGDCLERLRGLEENSVDSVVTDPPYFLTSSMAKGFMGKEWDGLSPKNVIAEVFLRSMRLDLSTGEVGSVPENASIDTKKKTREAHSAAPSAQTNSEDPNLKSNQNTRSARDLVLTRAEVLDLCKGLYPNHTRQLASLPESVRFVIKPLSTEVMGKDIAQNIAHILQEEPKWQGQITSFIEAAEKRSRATEAKSGHSSESKYIDETTGDVEFATNIVRELISSVITSNSIEIQKIITRVISSPCAKAAILRFTKDQSLIPITSQQFHKAWAFEAFRVLKPGGYLLAFSGTRTYHRLACGVEDAGFEVRDMISWLHGQGFPKSLDISKAIDKAAGAEREVVGIKPGHEDFANRKTTGHTQLSGDKSTMQNWVDQEKRARYHELTSPATPSAKQWDGFGTALKPSNEPIVMARKPCSEKTVADNVLKWGTGGINIDQTRIIPGGDIPRQSNQQLGRFPANTVLSHHGECVKVGNCHEDCAVRMLDEQSGESTSGGASRFFKTFDSARFQYVAKPSRAERNEGTEELKSEDRQATNHHPTVKPIKLMKYLTRLVTPPGGKVLDCFTGSGTTALAAIKEGFSFVGVEKELEYCDIARARIETVVKKDG